MAIFQAQNQRALTKYETITSFESWKENFENLLTLDPYLSPFLNISWEKWSKARPFRGFVDDVSGEIMRPAQQKAALLEILLGQIANLCPIISRHSITRKSTSLTHVWQMIQSSYGFQARGTLNSPADQLDCDIAAGTSVCVDNDVATRPAREQIVISGSDVVPYGARPCKIPDVHPACSTLFRALSLGNAALPCNDIELTVHDSTEANATHTSEQECHSPDSFHAPTLDSVQCLQLHSDNSANDPDGVFPEHDSRPVQTLGNQLDDTPVPSVNKHNCARDAIQEVECMDSTPSPRCPELVLELQCSNEKHLELQVKIQDHADIRVPFKSDYTSAIDQFLSLSSELEDNVEKIINDADDEKLRSPSTGQAPCHFAQQTRLADVPSPEHTSPAAASGHYDTLPFFPDDCHDDDYEINYVVHVNLPITILHATSQVSTYHTDPPCPQIPPKPPE